MSKNIIARISVNKNHIEDFITEANRLAVETRLEKGCQNYKFYQEISQDNNEFLFYEIFDNEEAIQAHNNSPHFKTFFENIAPILLKEPTVEIH